MNGIKDENFYTVLGWMLNVLELKGNELIIFAIIYSFSQDGESEFKGSLSYLQSFSNIKSKQTVLTTLDALEAKKLIRCREFTSGRKLTEDGKISRRAYSANLDAIEAMKKGISSLKPDNNEGGETV